MAYHPPLPATPESVALLNARHDRYRAAARALLWPMMPLSWDGHEAIPREGPLVVLANHVAFHDSITVNIVAGRAMVVMGTESMAQGLFGRLTTAFGLSPKKKNMPDSRAVRLMKSWVDAGAAICIFPEGQRTWDGRPLPLLSGIEKLVLLLGVPVVTMRITNGYRQWPRWAATPRRARVHVSVDPPVTFARKDGAAQVLDALVRKLRVDDREGDRPDAVGVRLAAGVTNVLFACPACGRVEALETRWDHVSCSACHAVWRVTTRSTLAGEGGETPLADLADRVRARLADRGWRDGSSGGDVLLRSTDEVTVLDHATETPAIVARGHLELRTSGLHLTGDRAWQIAMSDIAAANVENRRRFWIRTQDGRVFEPSFPRESVLKWELFVDHWRKQVAAPVATEA